MTKDKPVRFGLLGAGAIAPPHAKGILAAEGCELAGLTDVNPEQAARAAAEYGCKAYRTYDEMLDDKAVDVICILTPNHLHHAQALAAAKAGKHMLVEKPPALTLAELDEMVQAARQANVKMGIVLQCRVRAPIRAMKQAIESGRFGKLHQADAQMKWYRTDEYYSAGSWHAAADSGSGVTMQLAFHYYDLLQHLFGPVTSVYARMFNLGHPQVQLEDTLHALLEYANGARGVVVASTTCWPGLAVRIEVHGDNGTAIMVNSRMDTWTFRDERPEDADVLNPPEAGTPDHQVVIEDMARVVREGGEPMITPASARVTLEIALAMYRSAASGQTVTLPLEDEP